jgi:SAM-dependent methyltransferase
VALADAAVLDFGCGWGRLTRLLARDVEPGALCGCDPDPQILRVCEQTRVAARFAFSAAVPDALPFDQRFDLVYAFSVFTHLSEPAHLACLRAIHAGLAEGGLLIATVRPPAYAQLGLDVGRAKLDGRKPAYAFVGHGGPLPDYGEAIVNMPYVRERWGELFDVAEVSLMLDDMYQVILTLRRR